MRLNFKLIALAVACFAVFLFTQFPARAAFMLASPAGVEAFGVTGSLWNGNARIINVAGQQLRNTQWSLRIGAVFMGQLAGDFKTRWQSGFIEGSGTVGLGGNVMLENVTAGFQLAELQAVFAAPDIQGQASIRISKLKLIDNWPVQLVGNGEVRDLSSALMGRGDAGRIGSVGIEFDTSTATDEDSLNGKISDIDGALEVKGSLLLSRPNNYALNVRIRPRPEASQALRSNVEFLGSPEADGFRVFQLAGSL